MLHIDLGKGTTMSKLEKALKLAKASQLSVTRGTTTVTSPHGTYQIEPFRENESGPRRYGVTFRANGQQPSSKLKLTGQQRKYGVTIGVHTSHASAMRAVADHHESIAE